jgi:hypothetical protein
MIILVDKSSIANGSDLASIIRNIVSLSKKEASTDNKTEVETKKQVFN